MTLVKYTEVFHPDELGAVTNERRRAAQPSALALPVAPCLPPPPK
jgi:hypothetical protein